PPLGKRTGVLGDHSRLRTGSKHAGWIGKRTVAESAGDTVAIVNWRKKGEIGDRIPGPAARRPTKSPTRRRIWAAVVPILSTDRAQRREGNQANQADKNELCIH